MKPHSRETHIGLKRVEIGARCFVLERRVQLLLPHAVVSLWTEKEHRIRDTGSGGEDD